MQPCDRLTVKEVQVAMLVWEGQTNREIANVIGTTEQVIKNYLRNTLINSASGAAWSWPCMWLRTAACNGANLRPFRPFRSRPQRARIFCQSPSGQMLQPAQTCPPKKMTTGHQPCEVSQEACHDWFRPSFSQPECSFRDRRSIRERSPVAVSARLCIAPPSAAPVNCTRNGAVPCGGKACN